jgi:muconate cycloisomerase
MRITGIRGTPLRIPLTPQDGVPTSHGSRRESAYVLVEVETDEGLVGLGEATVDPLWTGEDAAGALNCLRRYLEPALAGADVFDLERGAASMARAVKGHPFTKAAVEMACLDAMGKALGVPLYRLLGGKVRERVPTKYVVFATEPQGAARVAAAAVARGFATIKVKVGRDPRADVARVRAVRAAIGPDVALTVDANTGWSVAEAIATTRALEEYDLLLVEQPVAADPRQLAAVRAAVRTPLMADESVFTPADALALVEKDAADILSVYPGKHGGVLATRRIVAVAEVAGLACHMGSNLELGIGSALMAHVAVSTPAIVSERYPADIIGPLYHGGDVVADTGFVRDGYAVAPEEPGLGVTLDRSLVQRYSD